MAQTKLMRYNKSVYIYTQRQDEVSGMYVPVGRGVYVSLLTTHLQDKLNLMRIQPCLSRKDSHSESKGATAERERERERGDEG